MTRAIDPAVAAERRRLNRLLVALAVLVALPFAIGFGGWGYARSEAAAWAAQPSFAIGSPYTVTLSAAGTYGVWTVPDAVTTCTVTEQGQQPPAAPLPSQPLPTSSLDRTMGGYTLGYVFEAPQPGSYTVDCQASAAGTYGMVSTLSPMGRITLILVVALLAIIASVTTGVVLLVLAISRNIKERRARPLTWYWPPQT